VIYLSDSDWIIDHLAGRREAVALLERLAEDGFGISLITYVEVYEGILGGRDPVASERLLKTLLAEMPVWSITRAIGRRAAATRNLLRAQGLPLPLTDVLIASTAIHRNLILVTRNLRHYQRIPDLKLYQEPSPAT
jgi:predicted nucleic acid-binding protein